MEYKSLEDKLQAAGDPVKMLRNSQVGPNVYPGVPPEYTNWRDEQWAWQNSAVLFNQSYHMADLAVEGPDALKLLSYLGVNSFKGFAIDKAKQFVPVTPYGHVIGDVILFYLAENKFNLVGRAPVLNWVTFHAQTGGFNVKAELDQRTALRTDGKRKVYRYQVQGPNAMSIIEKAIGSKPGDLKFFNMTSLNIGGKKVRALRHGMAGQPGWELFGPWEEGAEVHAALVKAGADYGMRLVGGRAYSSNTLESGWVPSPLPAIYSGDKLKAYREWLPVAGYEATCSIGGSFISNRIEDYYFTPWDLSYGNFVKFDHDFIGREALEKMQGDKHRHKVTLALNDADVAAVAASQFGKNKERGKFMEYPSAVYSMHPMDQVLVRGRPAGVSTWIGYSSNERKMLTLAILDAQYAKPGTEAVLVWGEENGGTTKPTVEKHAQKEIRAIVSPVPYVEVVRTSYADTQHGWRAQA